MTLDNSLHAEVVRVSVVKSEPGTLRKKKNRNWSTSFEYNGRKVAAEEGDRFFLLSPDQSQHLKIEVYKVSLEQKSPFTCILILYNNMIVSERRPLRIRQVERRGRRGPVQGHRGPQRQRRRGQADSRAENAQREQVASPVSN